MLLTSVFRSLIDALIIMVNLPLALAGGVVGVWFSGGILSVASMIGFIALFGIATRNGIMLVAHIAQATGLALVPVAMGMGEPGSEIQAPMAFVILTGLFSATALNMLVVPAAYWLFGRRPTAA